MKYLYLLLILLSSTAFATVTSIQDPNSLSTLKVNPDRSIDTKATVVGGSITVGPTTAATATITNVSTVSGSSVTLVGTNLSRKGLILYNLSAGQACYIAFAATASPTSFTFSLSQGSVYTMDTLVFQGAMSAYCNTGSVLVTEE